MSHSVEFAFNSTRLARHLRYPGPPRAARKLRAGFLREEPGQTLDRHGLSALPTAPL